MSATQKKQKIAILGGGMAALTAAFELTSRSDWQEKYEITVYQMGWRLGRQRCKWAQYGCPSSHRRTWFAYLDGIL
ncbi:MAG: NAD(P)-binding protein [Pseudanabaena sp. SU_2_4]|nr:NAD(P)-binding protein [Pseudanabaena sp. SU_2_4]